MITKFGTLLTERFKRYIRCFSVCYSLDDHCGYRCAIDAISNERRLIQCIPFQGNIHLLYLVFNLNPPTLPHGQTHFLL